VSRTHFRHFGRFLLAAVKNYAELGTRGAKNARLRMTEVCGLGLPQHHVSGYAASRRSLGSSSPENWVS